MKRIKKKVFINSLILLLQLGIYYFLVTGYVRGEIRVKRGSFFVTLIFLLLFSGIIFFRENIKWIPMNIITRGLMTLIAPMLGIIMIETICNSIKPFEVQKLFLNYIILFLIISIPCMVWNIKIVLTIFYSILFLYATVSHYLLIFKGSPLRPAELLSYRTGLAVAKDYVYQMSDGIVNGILILLFGIAIVCFMKSVEEEINNQKQVKKIATGLVGIMISLASVYFINWEQIANFEFDYWWPQSSYSNYGSVLVFAAECHNSKIQKPRDYSIQNAKNILKKYEEQAEVKSEEKPIVIGIMNETFSDLSIFGDLSNVDCFENWNQVSDYIMKGNVYASVFGGGTANSEFEFLTGNSTADIQGFPYQMYNMSNVQAISTILNRGGYRSIAMHPQSRNNWNRNNIYTQLEFEKFLAYENFENLTWFGGHILDTGNYEQLIKEVEQAESGQFIFNVTMQNHAGYDRASFSEEEKSRLIPLKEEYTKYGGLDVYLSLIRESDRAFAELLAYLRTIDKHVIVCIFGDHQPRIANFYEDRLSEDTLEETQKRYKTPYMIWANYDTGIKQSEKDMGINYLGANLLDIIGIHIPYRQFQMEMAKEIPIYNAFGYMTKDKKWHTFDEENQWIHDYRILEYYMMFDNKEKEK